METHSSDASCAHAYATQCNSQHDSLEPLGAPNDVCIVDGVGGKTCDGVDAGAAGGFCLFMLPPAPPGPGPGNIWGRVVLTGTREGSVGVRSLPPALRNCHRNSNITLCTRHLESPSAPVRTHPSQKRVGFSLGSCATCKRPRSNGIQRTRSSGIQ